MNPFNSDIKDVECFGCGKKGHSKTDCPELSHSERKAVREKRDKKYEKKKAMIADDAEDSSSNSTPRSSNSTSSDDESQALIARHIKSIGNGIDDSEVNSRLNSLYIDTSFMAGDTSFSDESSLELDEFEEVMCDYKLLKVLYEDQIKENLQLKAEVNKARIKDKKISKDAPNEYGLDEFILEILKREKEISLLKKEKKEIRSILDETKTELGRYQIDLKESKHLVTQLNHKMEAYVKQTMRLSSFNEHTKKSNLIEAVTGKYTTRKKGKKRLEEPEVLDDVSSIESIDWNEIEDEKRRNGAHSDVPPPKI